MTKFNEHTGIVVPLDITNIDTDNIIPKQFLQKITRENFGEHLFNNWRFSDTKNKKINQKFILNYPCYKNASILLTRENFGCGSSREHAVWALIDYGFRVIISSSFADIFYNNSFNNQLLLITLSKSQIEELFTQIKTTKDSCNIFTVNLIKQKLYTQKKSYYFQIKKFYRDCILYGLDHVDSTLMHEKDIQKYEDKLKHY